MEKVVLFRMFDNTIESGMAMQVVDFRLPDSAISSETLPISISVFIPFFLSNFCNMEDKPPRERLFSTDNTPIIAFGFLLL